jgi:hypothetical protein
MSKIYNTGIKVEKSKFSVLKIEDDDDDRNSDGEVRSTAKNASKSKKTVAPASANQKQASSQKSKKNAKSAAASSSSTTDHQEANKVKQFKETDWETWKKKDEEVISVLLKFYLMTSKLYYSISFFTKVH